MHQKTCSEDRARSNCIYTLTGCVAVIGANSLLLGPISPLVSNMLEAPVSTVMMASASFGLGASGSALFLAHFIDKFGAMKMLRLTMLILPIVFLLSAVAPNVAILILSQFLAGVASGVALPAIYSNATQISLPGSESKTIGIVLSGWTISMVAGVSISALIADFVNWRFVYFGISLLALIAFFKLNKFMVFNFFDKNSREIKSPISAFTFPKIKILLICCSTFMMTFYGFYAFVGDYLKNSLGQPVSMNGLITVFYGVGFAGAVFFDKFTRSLNRKKSLTVSLFLVSISYLLIYIFMSNVTLILFSLILLGLANHYTINLLIMRLTETSPENRGAIMGLYSSITNFSVFLGVSVFGQIYNYSGFGVVLLGAFFLVLLSSIFSSLK